MQADATVMLTRGSPMMATYPPMMEEGDPTMRN